jgi:hypothetical protein
MEIHLQSACMLSWHVEEKIYQSVYLAVSFYFSLCLWKMDTLSYKMQIQFWDYYRLLQLIQNYNILFYDTVVMYDMEVGWWGKRC